MKEINSVTLTPSEYAGYQPFLEEVGDVAKRNLIAINTGEQAMTYLQYFLQKEEVDRQLWNDLDEAITRCVKNSKVDTLISFIEILKHNDMLTSEVAIAIANELKTRIGELSPNDVPVVALLVYSCTAGDDKFTKDLQEVLLGVKTQNEDVTVASEYINRLSTEAFALICHIAHTYGADLSVFLDTAKPYAIKHFEYFTFSELADVIHAYGMLMEDGKMLREAEKYIIEHGRKVTITECLALMQAYNAGSVSLIIIYLLTN